MTTKTKKKSESNPVENTEETSTAPARRHKVYFAGVPFYVDSALVGTWISIEAATRGMSREELTDWIQRYGVRIEVWKNESSNEKLVLCDGMQILGDWLP